MTYTPVIGPALSDAEMALIQDAINGRRVERMSDAELAYALLDLASEQPAASMRHVVLDEAARRLSPDIAADPPGLLRIPAVARIARWINTMPPLGAAALGFCIGGRVTRGAVYAFVTQFIQ